MLNELKNTRDLILNYSRESSNRSKIDANLSNIMGCAFYALNSLIDKFEEDIIIPRGENESDEHYFAKCDIYHKLRTKFKVDAEYVFDTSNRRVDVFSENFKASNVTNKLAIELQKTDTTLNYLNDRFARLNACNVYVTYLMVKRSNIDYNRFVPLEIEKQLKGLYYGVVYYYKSGLDFEYGVFKPAKEPDGYDSTKFFRYIKCGEYNLENCVFEDKDNKGKKSKTKYNDFCKILKLPADISTKVVNSKESVALK